MKKAPFYRKGLFFQCTACGQCCSLPEGEVFLSEEEVLRIGKFLQLTETSLLDNGLIHIDDRGYSLAMQADGRCIFLEDTRCRIYPVRPRQCQTFPFWEEILTSRFRWKETARWCPGMNHGKFYSFEAIESIRLGKQNQNPDE